MRSTPTEGARAPSDQHAEEVITWLEHFAQQARATFPELARTYLADVDAQRTAVLVARVLERQSGIVNATMTTTLIPLPSSLLPPD